MKKITSLTSIDKGLRELSEANKIIANEMKILQDAQRAQTELFELKTRDARKVVEETSAAIEDFTVKNKSKIFNDVKSKTYTFGTLKLRKLPDVVEILDDSEEVINLLLNSKYSSDFIRTKYELNKKVIGEFYKSGEVDDKMLNDFKLAVKTGSEKLTIDTF
jgi:phage host-nuclease inhibitor protein Gam